MHRRHLGTEADKLAVESEKIRLIEDRSGTGRADHAETFAEGFNTIADGVAAGVIVRKGEVWFWQADEEDHVESLTCPVLIPAEALRKLLADRAAQAVREYQLSFLRAD